MTDHFPYSEIPFLWLNAAHNTLKAPRWKVTLAKLFGRRFTGEDHHNGITSQIVGYEWRGKLYMTQFRDAL